VLVVETAPGVPARVDTHPLMTPWQLRTVRGTLADLEQRAKTVGDAWLRVYVQEAARAGLADEVRALLPRAVDVKIERTEAPDTETPRASRQGRSARDLFAEYLAGRDVDDPRVLALFERLHDEVLEEAANG
jgi:exonuclease SbcD